jgi:hypothetical protein
MFNEELRIEDMSLEGFRIVQSQYFSKLLEPSMTIWSTSISFNMMAYAALNNCDTIQILVHDKEKSVIIKPSHSQEPNAIDWKKTTSKTKSGRLECTAFMRPLFQMWGLNPECRYRTIGRVVQNDRKVMLCFNFENSVSMKGLKTVKDNERES